MAKFALVCEGITDHIVIENILCGFYKGYDDFDDDEIHALQPPYDETTKKQIGQGGWEILLEYLSEERFRDDVLNSEYVVIQIDTDDSEHVNFDISHSNSENKEHSVDKLIENIIARLISQIDSKEVFYENHQEKIIFAISVHSLECWILPLYKHKNNDKTKSCYRELERHISVEKDYKIYDKLSRPFLKNKTLLNIKLKSSSLEIFLDKLPIDIS